MPHGEDQRLDDAERDHGERHQGVHPHREQPGAVVRVEGAAGGEFVREEENDRDVHEQVRVLPRLVSQPPAHGARGEEPDAQQDSQPDHGVEQVGHVDDGEELHRHVAERARVAEGDQRGVREQQQHQRFAAGPVRGGQPV